MGDRRGEDRPDIGKGRFTGELFAKSGREKSQVGDNTSGIESAPSWDTNLCFVGDDRGVKKGLSISWSISRKNRQLRLLRGDPGVLGDDQPSVLIVLVGDRGGVVRPDSDGVDSSSVTYIVRSTES